MQLTKNFTYEEFTKSTTAKKLKIDNTPTKDADTNIRALAYMLQKIRDRYGKPIIIDSGYRCEELNKIVGGASNSDHKYGAAVDIHSLSDSIEDNKELFDVILELASEGNILLRQIIWEYGKKDIGPDWIHIGLNSKFNKFKKNQILYYY